MVNIPLLLKSEFLPNDKEFSYLYHLVDPITNEVRYVGQTKNPEIRFNHHRYEAKKRKHCTHKNNWLYSLINKDLFAIMNVVAVGTQDVIDFAEIEEIKKFNNLTNHSLGGKGNSSKHNRKHTLKTRKKISEANKGKLPKNFYEMIKIAASLPRTEKQLANSRKKGRISWNKGIKMSPAHCKMLSDKSEHLKIKIVDQFGTNYDSISDAARKINSPKYRITQVLDSKSSHVKGFVFKRVK